MEWEIEMNEGKGGGAVNIFYVGNPSTAQIFHQLKLYLFF